MDEQLKTDADALWEEAMAKAGFLERRALAKRKELFFWLIERHFGSTYAELAAMKGGQPR